MSDEKKVVDYLNQTLWRFLPRPLFPIYPYSFQVAGFREDGSLWWGLNPKAFPHTISVLEGKIRINWKKVRGETMKVKRRLQKRNGT